jgi:hypothetical protein
VTKRFYFDLTDGYRTLSDDEGVEALTLDRAISQALLAMKEMSQSGELDRLGNGWRMIIRDEAGIIRQEFVIERGESTISSHTLRQNH